MNIINLTKNTYRNTWKYYVKIVFQFEPTLTIATSYFTGEKYASLTKIRILHLPTGMLVSTCS